MTDSTIQTIGAIVIAFFVFYPQFITLRQSKANAAAQEETKATVDEVAKQNGLIYTLVDGNLSKVQSDLAASRQEVKELHTLVAALMQQSEDDSAPGAAKPDVAQKAADAVSASVETLKAVGVIEKGAG